MVTISADRTTTLIKNRNLPITWFSIVFSLGSFYSSDEISTFLGTTQSFLLYFSHDKYMKILHQFHRFSSSVIYNLRMKKTAYTVKVEIVDYFSLQNYKLSLPNNIWNSFDRMFILAIIFVLLHCQKSQKYHGQIGLKQLQKLVTKLF